MAYRTSGPSMDRMVSVTHGGQAQTAATSLCVFRSIEPSRPVLINLLLYSSSTATVRPSHHSTIRVLFATRLARFTPSSTSSRTQRVSYVPFRSPPILADYDADPIRFDRCSLPSWMPSPSQPCCTASAWPTVYKHQTTQDQSCTFSLFL
jgi:hypothetical protein